MNQGEIEALSVITEQAASRLEKEIMLDIVRRIKANEDMTSSAEYQIQRLRQLGDSEEYIRSQIQTYLKATNEEMERIFRAVPENEYHKFDKIFEETGVDRVPFLDNTELQGLISSTLKQTGDTFQNITNTLGFQVMKDGKRTFTTLSQYYQETLDNAVLGMTTGAFSYDVVLKKVVMEMTKSGVRTVDYASGRSYRIESASRTALMTGFRQITGYMNEQTAQELGTNDYETTYHIGARPSHQTWQGKVFSYQELESVCGLGSVTGLCGANCYHWYEPFILGISVRNYTDEQLDQMIAEENKPRYYEGKEYTTYTALQKQRNMELLMRKQRQDIVLLKEGEGNEFDILTAQIKYRTTTNQYVEFSKAMNLPQQRERIYMDGLGRVGSYTAKHRKYETDKTQKKTERENAKSRYSRFSDRFQTYNNGQKDIITYRRLLNNLNKSNIGKETVEYILGHPELEIQMCYGIDHDRDSDGVQFGDIIRIYASDTKTVQRTAEVLIHEVTHHKYDIGGSQWAECVCKVQEIKHKSGRDKLTGEELRSIIKLVKELYPEYSWR